MPDAPVTKVLIVGGGTAGWMAAAVLSKALGRDVAITLVESDAIGTVGVGEATIPQIQLLNRFLGLDEAEFLRATQASYKLGIQFNGWGGERDSYIHAFGDIGAPVGQVPFHQLWLRARATGHAPELTRLNVNARAALSGRMAQLDRVGASPLTGIRHAYHFDAGLYARYLRSHAEARGVTRVEGHIRHVAQDPEAGMVTGVTLNNGDTLTADFFVDCSGFRGLLIEQTLHAGYEDWTHWLPCDRAVAVPSAHGAPLRPYTQSTARAAGWQWRIPLQHRVGNGHVFCSAHVSEDEATATLLANLEGEALADPRTIRFTTGRRKQAWSANVVALGLAGGFMEPLESTSIHLIQSGIDRLITLWPTCHPDPALIAEYNRQTAREYERIRDFIILHYHANQRRGGFWQACRAMPIPDTLAHKMALFRASGRIVREDEELFTVDGWLQVMLGQNITPTGWHPLASRLSDAQLARYLGDISALVDDAVAAMPPHRDYISSVIGG